MMVWPSPFKRRAIQVFLTHTEANVFPEGVLLFYKSYIVYYNVYHSYTLVCSFKRMCLPRFVLIGGCVSELHAHLCPYRNVWFVLQEVLCLFTC